ncbi:hypothetical protein [Gordonia sp. DT101]|uniref:hypothetical protein n=1 Tax=Gordonia sp. DT101 TaxID=3416545 RepID=UPI003CFB5462
MSYDDLHIAPDRVKTTGGKLSSIAGQALSRTNTYFDSQATAASDNPGFATGPKLIAYATELHNQINGFITDLSCNAEGIIGAAESFVSADPQNAAGFNRELAALNGLTKPPIPGR